MLKALIIHTLVGFREGFIDQFKAGIDDLVVLDREDSVRLPQKVHVVRLFDQDKEVILEDCSNFSRAAEERTLFDGFDKSPHRYRVVILVSHDRGLLAVSTTNASCLKSNFARDVSELDHTRLVIEL